MTSGTCADGAGDGPWALSQKPWQIGGSYCTERRLIFAIQIEFRRRRLHVPLTSQGYLWSSTLRREHGILADILQIHRFKHPELGLPRIFVACFRELKP